MGGAMTGNARRHRLDLPFKGGRSYLHGTDIIPALLEIAGPVRSFSVQIHRVTSHVLVAEAVSEAEVAALRRARTLCVLMSYETLDGDKAMLAVTEDPLQTPAASVPYDEAAVVRTATRCGDRIEQGGSSIGSLFERIVALNKRLLSELEGELPWLFCALELSDLPKDSTPLSLASEGRGGRGIYKSRVAADGVDIGTVIFARAPES